MSLKTDLGDVVRAVLEGVSLETAWVFESFKKRGIRIDNVKLSGGGAKSELWAQLQADIYGIAVERLKVDDATILGAAILGALGVGAFETIEDAAAAMVHTVRQYEPQSARTDQYQKRLQSFKSLYLTLREFQATSVEGA
jgi:xylulokinase